MALRNAVALGHSHLYHYQSFNVDYLREIIVGGAIYFSKPTDFNDPWDCQPFFDYECISDPDMREHHVQWYIEITKKHRPDIATDELNRLADVSRVGAYVLLIGSGSAGSSKQSLQSTSDRRGRRPDPPHNAQAIG
jgi:hypothetical protein